MGNIQFIRRLQRRAERVVRTDLGYIASSGGWITFGNIISSIASFALVIAFGNLLSPTSYGIYQYVISIAAILAAPTLAGINTAVNRAVAQGREGSVIEGLQTKIKWGLLGGLGGLVLAAYYYINDNNVLAISFLITSLFLPFMDSLNLYVAVLGGRKMFKQSTIYAIISNTTRVAVLISILFITDNIFLIVAAYFVITTMLRALFLFVTLQKANLNKEKDPALVPYGKHLSFITFFGTVATNLDKVLLFQYLGPVQLATYSFALSPISRLKTLLSPIESLAFPKFAQRDPETLRSSLPRKVLLFTGMILVIVIAYGVAAPILFQIFLPQYLDAIPYTIALALSLLFIPQRLLASSLAAHARKKSLYVIHFIGPSIRILLLITLLPILGIWGAIVALLSSSLVSSGFTMYLFRKM